MFPMSEEIKGVQRPTEERKQETKTWPNGDSYQGQLLDGKPHGQGTMNYAGVDRRTYVGNWVNGARQGRGEVTWPSGARFEGEFRNDKANGQGMQTEADGGFYIGSWRDNQMNGHGVYTYPSGARYEGEFKDDHQHGHGVYTWPDGARHEGQFKNDKPTDLKSSVFGRIVQDIRESTQTSRAMAKALRQKLVAVSTEALGRKKTKEVKGSLTDISSGLGLKTRSIASLPTRKERF
jgi:hypothetical protein